MSEETSFESAADVAAALGLSMGRTDELHSVIVAKLKELNSESPGNAHPEAAKWIHALELVDAEPTEGRSAALDTREEAGLEAVAASRTELVPQDLAKLAAPSQVDQTTTQSARRHSATAPFRRSVATRTLGGALGGTAIGLLIFIAENQSDGLLALVSPVTADGDLRVGMAIAWAVVAVAGFVIWLALWMSARRQLRLIEEVEDPETQLRAAHLVFEAGLEDTWFSPRDFDPLLYGVACRNLNFYSVLREIENDPDAEDPYSDRWRRAMEQFRPEVRAAEQAFRKEPRQIRNAVSNSTDLAMATWADAGWLRPIDLPWSAGYSVVHEPEW